MYFTVIRVYFYRRIIIKSLSHPNDFLLYYGSNITKYQKKSSIMLEGFFILVNQ